PISLPFPWNFVASLTPGVRNFTQCNLPGLITGPYISLEPYLTEEIQPGHWNEADLTWGIQSNFGGQLKILWWDLIPHDFEVLLFDCHNDPPFHITESQDECGKIAMEHGWPSYTCAQDEVIGIALCGNEGYVTPNCKMCCPHDPLH